jgi:hypothetical protein
MSLRRYPPFGSRRRAAQCSPSGLLFCGHRNDAISDPVCSGRGSWRAINLPRTSQRVITRSASCFTNASYAVRATSSRSALFCSAAELDLSEAVMLRPYCSDVRSRSIQSLATNDLVCSIQLRGPNAINEQCGWHDTHTGKICATGKKRLQFTLPGF